MILDVTPSELRDQLGLTRLEWARALGVHERTVARWEDDGVDPGGLANEVMAGVALALAGGLDPKKARLLIGRGIGALVHLGLTHPTRKQ